MDFPIILAGSESPTFLLPILRALVIYKISGLDPNSLGSFEDSRDCPKKKYFYLHSYQSGLSMSQKNIIVKIVMIKNKTILWKKMCENIYAIEFCIINLKQSELETIYFTLVCTAI